MRVTLIFLAFSLFISACSSPTVDGNSSANSDAPNNELAADTNSKLVPLENVNANAFNAPTADLPVVNRNSRDIEPVFGPRPAPDASEFHTIQRPDGSFAETRTFKNHPQLLKVERITAGSDVKMKVYLKNGKVIPIESEKLPHFNVIAPGNILAAVGIKPAKPESVETKVKKAPENEPVSSVNREL